ncbi:MAG: DUF4082 domain-containing protein [Verrucomicrobiota bacterium]
MNYKSRIFSAAVAGLALLIVQQARAQAIYAGPGSDVTGGGWSEEPNGLAGTEFTANVSFNVTELGVAQFPAYNPTPGYFEGNTESHVVTLFTAGGVQLAQANVPFGSPDANGYDWAQLATGVELTAGQTYILGAAYQDDHDWFYDTATINSDFTLVSAVEGNVDGTGLYTEGMPEGNGWFGPNLGGTVPDGGMTMTLLGMALVGLGFVRRQVKM